MEDIIKSDVFFFVTTLAVIIITSLIATMAIFAIKVLRDFRFIMRDAKTKYRLAWKIIKTFTRF